MTGYRRLPAVLVTLALLPVAWVLAEETFTIATFNVENWNRIEREGQPNQPKPQPEKDAVVSVITTARPDVLGIVEMGGPEEFAELRGGLRAKGLDYPYGEHLPANDPDRHVCLLSRFPIVQRHSRADLTYPLDGRRIPMSRGILDVRIKVNDSYSFRAVVVHLKSKRQSDQADQSQMRLGEARLLRAHIRQALTRRAQENLVAMGDFNDTPDSEPLRTLIGEPPWLLFPLPCQTVDGYEGTHYWKYRRLWSRLDYLIASPGMSNEYVAGSARIYSGPDAPLASDHRLIYASFLPHDVGTPPAGPFDFLRQIPPSLLYLIAGILLVLVIGLTLLLVYTRRHSRRPPPP